MEQNMNDMVAQYAEWMELDDIDKRAVLHLNEKKQEALVETFTTIAECLNDTTPSQFNQHLHGVAHGMLDICLLFEVFSKNEYDVLKDILAR